MLAALRRGTCHRLEQLTAIAPWSSPPREAEPLPQLSQLRDAQLPAGDVLQPLRVEPLPQLSQLRDAVQPLCVD